MEDDTYEIGYREDAVIWVTQSAEVPDAAAAERYANDPWGDWRTVAEVYVGPTGEMLNSKDEEWAEVQSGCSGGLPRLAIGQCRPG